MTQAGYCERLSVFSTANVRSVVDTLKDVVGDAGDSQIRAWRDSIAILQSAVTDLIGRNPRIGVDGSVLLEYTIPLESRRIDALLLLNGVVIVIEFKGKRAPTLADIDQAAAYARDLRAYHRDCVNVPVKCCLIPTLSKVALESINEIDVISPDDISTYCENLAHMDSPAPNADEFLELDCYQPLPSLIKAARELFTSGSLTRIHRAAVATEPTLEKCSEIVHRTAKNGRRALVLISGVPGAGKTLVGLQLAHASYLNDLSVARKDGEKPTATAIFLSGNGPLVEVLQYELRTAGGDGKAFVRGVHEYVKTFTNSRELVPSQHVLIYDEAQRAFDALQVHEKHKRMPSEFNGLSEPELFIQFAERVPEWSVIVGLIGTGQEIHIGEEAGVGQWRDAIANATASETWDVYLPNNEYVENHFGGLSNVTHDPTLELSETIRFHLATTLYEFVKYLLDGNAVEARKISTDLERNGYNLRLTHDLEQAKNYLRSRYDQNRDARFGIIASARDKDLNKHGIPKGFKSPGEVGPGKYGKWYSNEPQSEGSCTNLDTVATEFGVQGLELDACLLAWGTDFIRKDGMWTNEFASGYRDKHRIVDAMALRTNAYRVLLTRGRDACVVYVPPISDKMRETYSYLTYCGFKELRSRSLE